MTSLKSTTMTTSLKSTTMTCNTVKISQGLSMMTSQAEYLKTVLQVIVVDFNEVISLKFKNHFIEVKNPSLKSKNFSLKLKNLH